MTQRDLANSFLLDKVTHDHNPNIRELEAEGSEIHCYVANVRPDWEPNADNISKDKFCLSFLSVGSTDINYHTQHNEF